MTLTLVQVWPNNTITVTVTAGPNGGIKGFYIRTTYPNRTTCDSFFDCPLEPYASGNVLLGDANHGCPLACGTTYKFKARADNDPNWGPAAKFSTMACEGKPGE